MKVTLDNPNYGWIDVSVDTDHDSVTFSASYTPTDSLSELASALLLMYRGSDVAEVHWHLEPETLVFRFTSHGSSIKFVAADRHMNVFAQASGDLESICMPFWRALCRLEGEFGPDELTRLWQRDWPSNKLITLTGLINDDDSKRPHT